MANNVEMQGIEFQIVNDSTAAERSLTSLRNALNRLKTATSGGTTGLSNTARSIRELTNSLKGLNSGDASQKITRLGKALTTLNEVGNVKISRSIGNQLTAISTALDGISLGATYKLTALADGLRPLSELGKANMTSFISQLRRLPAVIAALDNADLNRFTRQMRDLASAMKPFADEMQKVSNGFSAFPSRIQRLVTSTERYNNTVKKSTSANQGWARSFSLLQKFGVWQIFRWVSKALAKVVTSASEYLETLNLFTASMGKYGEEAYNYAQKVSEVMGIDPAEWMQNQGVFNTIIAGFGVAGDKAAFMSKNLTQLGYDLASFYNIDFESAMQKVQSGIAGELEPLRRLGYDLSVARLEQERLNLGISKSVSKMTQAEKSQLRYYAMLTQVTEAQGDMARTLEQPTNMIRVLKAQLEQAARAIGNLFIPVLTKILPVAIAVASALREIVASIASLFGVELQEVDWSGSVSASSDVADNLEDAVGSAKDLKRYLAGFDELNVLPSSTSGGSGGVSAGGGSDLGINLPGYDFLSNAVSEQIDKYKKKLEPLVAWIKENITEITISIAAIGAMIAIPKLWKAIKSVWKKFLGLKIVDRFLDGFSLIRVTGGSVFQSIVGGIDAVRSSLTGIQKAAIVAVAGISEFLVVKSSVKDLASSCENVGSKITAIGVAATVAGAAMYVALGPYGLALAAVVGLAGAVSGMADAMDEARQKVVDEAFFDGVGVSLNSLNDKLQTVTEKYSVQNQQLSQWAEQMEANQSTIDNAALKFEVLNTALGTTGEVTAEEVAAIKAEFETLYNAIDSNLQQASLSVTTALSHALQEARPELHDRIDELIGEYQYFVRKTQGRAEELNMLISNSYDELVGKQKDDPQYQEIMDKIQEWYEELGYLSGGMSDASWQWQQTVADFNNGALKIDFGGDTEEAAKGINAITQTGITALNDLATARDSVLKQIDEQMRYVSQYGTEDEYSMLGDIRSAIANDYAQQEADIKSELVTIFEAIQTSAVNQIYDTDERLNSEWDSMSWLSRGWYRTPAKYVYDGITSMQKDVNAISTAVQSAYSDLGLNGSVWASDAIQLITDSFIHVPTSDAMSDIYDYKMTLDAAVQNTFAQLEDSGVKTASTASGTIATTYTNGISDGITSKIQDVQTILGSFADDVFGAQDANSYGYSYGQEFSSGLKSAIRNTKFPDIKGKVAVNGNSASLRLEAYADGGFVDAGQLFVAREAGAEMVGSIGRRTAVANNDQIVESVSSGVYKAVAAAMSNGNDNRGRGQTVTAKVNSKTLFEVIVDYARNETVRTGSNPLLEF